MAKRFTDTELWKEDWFIGLSKDQMLFWQYVKDNCDFAGIWRPNTASFNKLVGAKIDLDNFISLINLDKPRIRVLENKKWYLVGFIEFQYGKKLNSNNRVHKAVLTTLAANDVDILPYTRHQTELSLTPNLPQDEQGATLKDKDTDKDKDKDIIKIKFRDFVYLTQDQYKKLISRLGNENRVRESIEILDSYLGQSEINQKKYTSHYHAILRWVIEELEKREAVRVRRGGHGFTETPQDKYYMCEACKERELRTNKVAHRGYCKNQDYWYAKEKKS